MPVTIKREPGVYFFLEKTPHAQNTALLDLGLPTYSTTSFLSLDALQFLSLFSMLCGQLGWEHGFPVPRKCVQYTKFNQIQSIVWEKQVTLNMLGKKKRIWRRQASFNAAPSLIHAKSWSGRIMHSTARHWVKRLASSSAFMLFARTSSFTSLGCRSHWLSIKRTTIAKASESLVLPSKITEKLSPVPTSDLTQSFSFLRIRGMSSFKNELRMSDSGHFFKKRPQIFAFDMRIPAVSKDSTSSNRHSLVSFLWCIIVNWFSFQTMG